MNIKELVRVIKAVIHRNCIMLAEPNREAKKNFINLHWWKLPGESQNVGDRLSPEVVNFLKNLRGIKSKDFANKTIHLLAIGSIIDGSYQDAVVWGSGLRTGNRKLWWRTFRKLDIRSVRGPETRRVLIQNGYECPKVYGDPAILLPLIYHPKEFTKKYVYRVVPHMSYGIQYPNVLSPYTNNWKEFIDGIVQSELIISSSLHGIILAEAYGIPAILLNDNDMNLFKYRDYYYSTDRNSFPIAKTVEEALNLQPASIPDFTEMRKVIIDTFPVDLWKMNVEL